MLPLSGGEWLVSFTTRNHPGELFDRLKGKEISVEIKKASPGRSRDANAMCWALCSDIGKAMKPPLAKEDVYRMAIKAVGVYIDKKLPVWNVETVRRRWEDHGTGWLFEVVDDAGIGWKLCNLYFGSSTYTADEMRVLIDWLVDQCEQMQISIPLSKKDEEDLLERWGMK
jgi:hypothetical protein